MKNFKLILKSLINNDACIEGGRTKRWFFAVIFVVLSVILATLPIMVNALKVNGSDFTDNNYVYNYDNAIVAFSDHLQDNNLSMSVNEIENERYLNVDQERWNSVHSGEDNIFNQYVHLNNDGDIDFEVYFTNTVGDEYATYVDHVQKNESPINGLPRDPDASPRTISFLLFGRKQMIGAFYQPDNSTAVTTISGDYLTLPLGFNFKSLATAVVDNVTYVTSHDAKFSEVGGAVTLEKYRDQVFYAWDDAYDDLHYVTKMSTARNLTLIFLGVDVGLIAFMGLMIFILTRGKKNPFRIYTFWETQKISYWASFAPSVLAMIGGFIFAQYAPMMFIMLIGIRIMWMSMKSLKPAM
ncbi:MAG: hypothetical protein WC344_02900 [Bacilli bacterium]|jgi:maltodextrin utilization protein YvdJ